MPRRIRPEDGPPTAAAPAPAAPPRRSGVPAASSALGLYKPTFLWCQPHKIAPDSGSISQQGPWSRARTAPLPAPCCRSGVPAANGSVGARPAVFGPRTGLLQRLPQRQRPLPVGAASPPRTPRWCVPRTASEPSGIPMGVIAHPCDQAGAQGIGNNVTGKGDEVFFHAHGVIVKTSLPYRATS
jgi:hypothetical protein